jgi:hypothetical protein
MDGWVDEWMDGNIEGYVDGLILPCMKIEGYVTLFESNTSLKTTSLNGN